jgi:dihydrofolate reductase
MRKLIAGMQSSVDGRIEGPDGFADWVETWADNYGLMPQVDACLLGAKMFVGYEQYWSAVLNEPNSPLPVTNRLPTRAELEWARFARETPHYVLSSTSTSTRWPKASFIRSVAEVADLKRRPGKDIYLVGGARTLASLVDAGLVDELRLHVHPLIVGEGKALFATAQQRRQLQLRNVQQLADGRVQLVYTLGD